MRGGGGTKNLSLEFVNVLVSVDIEATLSFLSDRVKLVGCVTRGRRIRPDEYEASFTGSVVLCIGLTKSAFSSPAGS